MPALRSIREFAAQEIFIPDGPFKGQRWRAETQPYAALWFDALMNPDFNRFVATGPSQSGKTLHAYVIPTMWHLFEVGEDVGCGVPSMDMAGDKWAKDFLPAIRASRYADLIPETGIGSRGGKFEAITFRNGATLKFLTAGGGDKKRAGYTVRVLIVTEVDGFDEAGELSREADPITQMEARTNSYGARKRIYLECTPSIEDGRIWQEYLLGTNSRIVMPCPHCDQWVSPERQHLLGWQDAADEIEARERSMFFCPECGTGWKEDQRRDANRAARLIHRGQEIVQDAKPDQQPPGASPRLEPDASACRLMEPNIVGEVPRTLTFSLRWSAVNNLFAKSADLGATEWKARRDVSEENAEKNLNQFVWALPVVPNVTEQTPLDVAKLLDRVGTTTRGIVPAGHDVLTAGLDLGGYWCHAAIGAWTPRGSGRVIDTQRLGVAKNQLGIEAALWEVLRQFRDQCLQGWRNAEGETFVPDQVLIDSGWMTDIVYQFVAESGLPFRACKGLAVGGQKVSYHKPKSKGNLVKHIGDGFHVVRLKESGIHLVEIDADLAKTRLHDGLASARDAAGSIDLFAIDRSDPIQAEERRRVVRSLTAEKATEEFVEGRGLVTHWTKIRPDNHDLDSHSLMLVGRSLAEIHVVESQPPPASESQPPPASEREPRGFVRKLEPRASGDGGWVRRRS